MDRTKIIPALLKVARPEILKEYRADSCIASTRIGMSVLDHFGVLSEPLPVMTTIYNPAFCARIDAGEKMPETQDELSVWVKEDGAWNVGIGYGHTPGKWPGHLSLIGERTCLIDLSIDQANRPQHKIELHPFQIPVLADFIDGKESVLFRMNGCVVRVLARPSNNGYTASKDWKYPNSRVVKAIIRRIEQEIS